MNNETRFANWLKSDEMIIHLENNFGRFSTFVKLAKNKDVDYLFCMENHNDNTLTREKSFQYAGIYCKRDGLIYDAQYSICALEPDEKILGKSKEDLLSELISAAHQRVEAVIGNDRKNLIISKLTSPILIRNLEYAKEYGAAQEAREYFLDTEGVDPPAYHCCYTLDEQTENSLLDYILDPEGFADREAAAYLAEKQEEILCDLLHNELVRAAYQELLEDSDNPVHSVKRIIQAVRASNAKTVRVTILKNGVEFAFKTETGFLCHDCTGNEYSTWQIEARDRRKFQEIFGRNEKYRPEEIVRIAYGRSVLYQREDKPIGGEAQ